MASREIQDIIQRSYLVSNGKTTTLQATSPRFIKFLALANLLQDDWMREPGVDWNSRYDRVSLGSITSDRVDLDETIYQISNREGDYVTIQTPDSEQLTYWGIVSANEFRRYQYDRCCTVIANELVFSHTFLDTDPQYNGEVVVPAYIMPDELAGFGDEIVVDDPNWLVYMMAAEQVRNTVTKQNQYGNLISLANQRMVKMKEANDSQLNFIAMGPTVLGESWSGGGWYGGGYSNSAGQPLGSE